MHRSEIIFMLLNSEIKQKRKAFLKTMDVVRYRCEPQPYHDITFTSSEKIELMKSYKKMILNELAAEQMSKMLHTKDGGDSRLSVFPSKLSVKDEPCLLNCNSKDITVIVSPREQYKLSKAVNRKDPFDRKKWSQSNILPIYYPSLRLLVVDAGGRHSVADAVLNREKFFMNVRFAEDDIMYSNYETDGAWWYEKENNDKEQVSDYRIAVAFQIEKIIRGLDH